MVIEAAVLQKLLMRAAFDHLSFVEDEDQIGVLNGGNSLCNDDFGAVEIEMAQLVLVFPSL